MVDSAKTTNDAPAVSSSTSLLATWREEVRGFVERTLQEIHSVVAGIQPKQPPVESASSVETRPRVTTTVRSESSNRSTGSEPLDSSRTRLENLKRRLSEKLQTQQTDRARTSEPIRKESHA